MSLIKCEECGTRISSKAKTCPHCGAPTDPERNESGISAAKQNLTDLERIKAEIAEAERSEKKTEEKQKGVVGCLWFIAVVAIAMCFTAGEWGYIRTIYYILPCILIPTIIVFVIIERRQDKKHDRLRKKRADVISDLSREVQKDSDRIKKKD